MATSTAFRKGWSTDISVPWVEVVAGLLLVMAWNITDHYPPWTGFHSELLAAFAGVIVVGSAAVRGRAARISPASIGLFAASAVVGLQAWAGLIPFRGDVVLVLLYLVGAALCVCAAQGADRASRDVLLRSIALAAVIGACLATAVSLYQWFGLSGLSQVLVSQALPGRRAVANLGQANHAATLMCLGLAALLALREWCWLRGPTAVVIAGFLLIGIALTQSRVPWLAVAVLLAWSLARRRALLVPLRISPAAVLLLAVWYAFVLWIAINLPDVLFSGFEAEPDGSRMGAGRRPMVWAQWLAALREAPWLGYGWGQGHTAQGVAALTTPGLEFSAYAHNLVLDLLVWNGLPIGVLLSLGLCWWYVRLGLRARGTEDWFRFAVVNVIGVHALVEYPVAYAYFLVPLALVSGQLDSQGRAENDTRRLPRWLFAGLACMWLAALGFVVRDYFVGESDIRQLREQAARIGGSRRLDEPPRLYALDQLAAFSRVARIQPRALMPAHEMDDLLSVARYFPSTLFLQQAALALAMNGQPDEARLAMRRLCGLHGDARYDAALARMQELAAEDMPAARDFVASLVAARLPESAAAMSHNRWTCMSR